MLRRDMTVILFSSPEPRLVAGKGHGSELYRGFAWVWANQLKACKSYRDQGRATFVWRRMILLYEWRMLSIILGVNCCPLSLCEEREYLAGVFWGLRGSLASVTPLFVSAWDFLCVMCVVFLILFSRACVKRERVWCECYVLLVKCWDDVWCQRNACRKSVFPFAMKPRNAMMSSVVCLCDRKDVWLFRLSQK